LAATAILILTDLVLAAIAVTAYRHWRRRGDDPARFVFAAFTLIVFVGIGSRVLPEESHAAGVELGRKLVLATLPLFPWFLFRFTTALKPTSPLLERVAAVATALVVLFTLATPPLHLPSDQPWWAEAYVAVLLGQWTALSSAVAVRLWRAGAGHPTVARRRMRTLGFGSIALAFALVVAGASASGGGEAAGVVIQLIGLASACLFAIAFTPPTWLRVVWRRPEQDRLRAAIAGLMEATDREHVTAALLPHAVAVVGGRGAALLDRAGALIASHGPGGTGPSDPREVVELDLPSGRLVVATGPYTPFFGHEELELLRSVGALAELALQRVELFEREHETLLALERQVRFSDRLIDSSVDGIIAFDPELRYTVWNPGMERIAGLPADQVLGRNAFEIFPFLVEIGEDRFFREALAGREATSFDRPYVVPESGQEGFFEARYAPLYGERGQIIGGLAVIRDVTERKHAEEERARLLREQAARAEAEATAEMVKRVQLVSDTALAHLTLDDLVDELLERTREILDVDMATILLLDPETQTLTVQASKGVDRDQDVPVPVGKGFAGRVAAERRAVVLDHVTGRDLVGPSLIRRGVNSLLGVPMIVAGRLTGVLHVGVLHDRRSFGDEDAGLLRLVADRAALALENSRLYRREHGIAETLQRSLLPEALPTVPGLAVAARYLPGGAGAVGGDWYDVIPLGNGRVGLAMGDVVGHGVGAASLMGQLRSGLRAYAIEEESPARVLERLDRLAQGLAREGMATLLYLVFDRDSSNVCFASAGHPPALVVEPGGGAHYLEDGRSVPLGVMPLPAYREKSVALEPGATLVLFTDGLVERRGASLDEGLERLRLAAVGGPAGADELCEHLVGALLPDGPATDDAALLALQRVPVAPAELTLELPAEPRSLAFVRTALRRWLADAEVGSQEIYDVLVATGEACSNVIEHAYGPGEATFELRASLVEGELEVTVADRGRWRPPRGLHRGRGLGLMRGLMDDVDVIPGDRGTRVVLRRRVRAEVLA
jgi:PAS domain S-box-containing protein